MDDKNGCHFRLARRLSCYCGFDIVVFITLRPGQNGRYFANGNSNVFLNENYCSSTQFKLKLFLKSHWQYKLGTKLFPGCSCCVCFKKNNAAFTQNKKTIISGYKSQLLISGALWSTKWINWESSNQFNRKLLLEMTTSRSYSWEKAGRCHKLNFWSIYTCIYFNLDITGSADGLGCFTTLGELPK